MKKLLSILLATLMLMSCLSITASAETETTDYVKLFADYGINVYSARLLGNAGEFELYDAGSQEIMNRVYEVPIGDYRFYSLGQFRPYDLGLFVRNADGIYTLGSAYEDGIINDDDMDAIYSVLRNEENRKKHFYWKVVKQGDATNEEQLFIQYQKDNNLYLFGPGEGDYLFKKLGEYKGYSLCFGYSHLSPMDWCFEIGTYKVYVRACCESLYLINDTQVIPVTVARDTGLIDDVEEFIYILNYNYYNYLEVIDKSVATTQRFCDSVKEYLRQLGMENDYPELTPENVYTSDWIEFYREDEDTAIFGIKGKTEVPTKEHILEYTFNSDTYFQESNPCGYCYYSENAGVVALQDTHKDNQAEMAKNIPGTLFDDVNNVYYVVKKYLEERNALNEHNNSFHVAVLGEVGEYTLCYGSGNMLYPKPTTVKIGEYNFTVQKLEMFSDYPLNLYLVKNGEIIPFDETAYENNIISDEDVATAVKLIKNSDATILNDWIVTDANGEVIPPDDNPPVDDPPVDNPPPVTDILVVNGNFVAGEQTPFFAQGNADLFTAFSSDNENVATVDENGVVTALKKGTAKITATGENKTFTYEIKVINNPELNVKNVTVKKNKTVKVKLTGKVKNIKNVYTNTKKAQIISGRKATKLKIKGLKKGTTTLRIKVNGVKTLKLKVKVI